MKKSKQKERKFSVKSMNAGGTSIISHYDDMTFEAAQQLLSNLTFEDVQDPPYRFQLGNFPTAWIEQNEEKVGEDRVFSELPKGSVTYQ